MMTSLYEALNNNYSDLINISSTSTFIEKFKDEFETEEEMLEASDIHKAIQKYIDAVLSFNKSVDNSISEEDYLNDVYNHIDQTVDDQTAMQAEIFVDADLILEMLK